MSAPDGVFICKGVRLHYERLCLAVRQTAPDQNHTPIQLEALAELQACRAQIAAPFDPQNENPPSQADRTRLTSSSGITILINPDVTTPESNPIPIRLGSDLVSVAIALSDELKINEVDAAILLYDARTRAARRPDHDVVAAAKEMFIARRRDSLLYLQEIIRAGLNHTEDFSRTDAFMVSLLKERDLLLTDYAVLKNIVDRLNDAFRVIDNLQAPAFRRLLASEECLLLAETLFLLTYTVQLTSTEGGYLFPVLKQTQVIYQNFHSRHNTGSHNSFNAPPFSLAKLPETGHGPRPSTVDVVRLQSVRNLIFLSWTAALDRSRYHNIYNPRTGSVGVNELLRDPVFVRSTNHVDALKEGEHDPIATTGPALAAAELIGSLFRLAVAVPDEDEAVTMFLRASAFGDALAFLSDEIIEWVQNGAGSLSPDTDLYADVVEDLALDIAEAPRLVAALVQYAQNETHELAANDALESLRSMGTGRGPEKTSFNLLSATPNSNGRPGDRSSARTSFPDVSGTRPPTHPKNRRNSRVVMHSSPGSSISGAFRAKIEDNLQGSHREGGRHDVDEARSASGASLVSGVATFVSKSVGAAPAKLQCDSVGGGMRYWVGIGQSSIGFIPRIGDAVIDMWDTAMKNANASRDVGLAFQLTLQGFLLLLKTTSERRGSPAHAAASLKYLRHGGHPVASLERAAGAITFITDSLSAQNPATTLDDAEAKALCGILDVISTAAEALEAHGGVMPILEDAGRDLASRLSSFIVLNIPLQLRESAIQCLKSLNYSRTVPVLLETLSSDKCSLLRHWARTEEAPSKTFSISTSVMGLVTRTLDGTETCSEKTLESIAVCYVIGEVLSFCNRRSYAVGAQRWEVLAAASEILVKLLAKNPSSSLSQQIATTLLQPAPGTGSASYSFQALCRTAGLLNKEDHPYVESRNSLHLPTEFTGALYGRALLTQVACLGLGDTFRWMRKAVLHSSRLLSLLLMVSPGRLSKAGIVTVSAVDLMTGEPESLVAASSLVYVPDGFDPVLSRAGYSVHLSATVLNMLSMAAQRSGVFASILTKDVPQTGGSASLFRACLSRILLDAPSIIGQLSAESVLFEGKQILPFEDSVLHSVLRLVEACLGPEGCAPPGMFLLGFAGDAFGHRNAIEHGILGALIELVAGTNPYHPFDDPCRAMAATFLEKLVSHTAKNTSSAVLDHIRSISAADSSVRGGGFADEMLMRVMEDTENQDGDPKIDFNWSSFSTFLSACMKLSTLHVRLFPEHEKHISEMTTSAKSISQGTENGSYKPETFSILPSPGALLDLVSQAATRGDLSSAIDALGAWSNLLGIRLSVHGEGTGYADDAVLLDIVMKLLSALSSDSCEAGIDGLVSANQGEIASASIFECVAKLSKRFESKGQKSLEAVTEDQMLAIIDGVCRGLVALSRGGSRSEKARTNLYGTLLSCCRPTGTDLSNTLLSRGLCKRSSDVGAVGVDGLIDVACSDALFGTTNASKSTAIALISRMVACEPSRTLHALSAQNRLRRLVTVSFSSLTSSSVHELSDSRGKNLAGEGSCAAVVLAVLSLIHSISVTASGGRLLSDAGCIEALSKLLTMFEGDLSWKYNRGTTVAYPSAFGQDVPLTSMDLTESERLVPDVVKNWQKSLLTSLTGVLATAVRCGGENVVEDVVFALDKGFSVFLRTLRNLNLPDEADLRPVCNLGMTLSRIPAHLVSVAVTCSQLRSNLAHIFGRIVPPVTKTQRLGESGSYLSAGINLKHPVSAKAARRIHIAHPEGGSLYERDTVRARATTLRSIFSSFTEATTLPFLFTPTLTSSRYDQDVQFLAEHPSPPGNLGEVLRIGQAMLREYNRSMNECMHLDRRASGDGRPSVRATAEIEYGIFCEEQYGIHPNALDQGLLRVCLKKEAMCVSRHSAVCMRVLEMALIILREYVVNASDIVQGKPVAVSDGQANFAEKYNGARGVMSVEIASSFLASANATIIPFCKDVENVQDGVDSATAGAFSRQVRITALFGSSINAAAQVSHHISWDPAVESLPRFSHMPSAARLASATPSYAQAVKSLTFSHVSLDDKLTTCRDLLSSKYYPDPSGAVLQFLSSCFSKDCPNVEDCYVTHPTQNIVQQNFARQWNLMSQALLRYTESAHDGFGRRESPLIADAVIIQGGLHLLRGSKILKESVSETLHLIVEKTRISNDIHTNTWLFCAVARAEGPRSVLVPLRSAVLSNFVQLLSRDSDKGRVSAAAACVASHAVPSEMAFEIEKILVDAIRGSLPSFQRKFGPWVLRSEASLPLAIQFLLRAYAKHPLQQELRSSGKRPRWDPVQRDAVDFFDTLSQHIHDILGVDGDTLSWDEKTFRLRMGAVCALYVAGSENAVYSTALDFADGQEKKVKNTFASGNKCLTNGSKTHGILKLILRASRLTNFEVTGRGVGLKLMFDAIVAIANFSFVTIDDFLPEIMELFLTPLNQNDTSVHMYHKRGFFCALLNRYERSRSANKLMSHLMGNPRVLQFLVPILKHRTVQMALASAFGNLRGAEGQSLLQSLVGKSRSSSTDIVGLTLISSLLLETSSESLVKLIADTIAKDVVNVLLTHTANPASRHCRTHLLASFLLARTAHKSLATEQTVCAGIFRLAVQGSKEDGSTVGENLESKVIDALTSREESLSPAELCSNLRCLTALTHYAFRFQNGSDDRKLISRSIYVSLKQFRMLENLNKKPNSPTIDESSLSRTLYDTDSFETVLSWIGSTGYVLRNYLSEIDDEAIEVFLKHSFFFFPAVHPFWRELSEETRCAPKISKVAILVLNELSHRFKCPKRVCICSACRVLETLSVFPVPFLSGPNHLDLLDHLLAYIKSPCCLESRHHALKAFLKLRSSTGFRTSLLTLCRRQDNRDVLETNRKLLTEPSEKSILSPYENTIAAMRVLASLVPEQMHLYLESEVASVLTARISRIRTEFETGLNPSLCSTTALCGIAEVLIGLRGNLHTIRAMDMKSSKLQLLEKTTTECIQAVLPICLKFLSKDSQEKTHLSGVAKDTLLAISRSTLPKHDESPFGEFSDTTKKDQIQICVSCLFHPQEDVQKLAIVLLPRVLVPGAISGRTLNQIFLSLSDRFFTRVRSSLNSILRNDTLPTGAARKDILVATKISTCCYLSCITSPMMGNSTSYHRYSHPGSDLQACSDSCFLTSMRLLRHLEVFVRIWSLAVRDMSERQMSKFRTSELLTVSDYLVCSLLRNCLQMIKADRFWNREDMEQCLLLTRQVVERVCSGKSFLENEGSALLTALRICRSAAKRYTALIPTTTQIIGLLFARGLSTKNETVLVAVRHAVEETCVLTKTWETLSALLADCTTALTQVVGTDCRREAERTVATLFKAVSEPKAQQVLGSLPFSGKEALTHIWRIYSDRLLYSGN